MAEVLNSPHMFALFHDPPTTAHIASQLACGPVMRNKHTHNGTLPV